MNKEDLKSFQAVEKLSFMEKAEVYSQYLATQLALKHNFIVVDKTKDGWDKNMGAPSKECKDVAFYYLWKKNNILSFEKFTSEDNISIVDCGEDWETKKYASRFIFFETGIFEWYWKIKTICK